MKNKLLFGFFTAILLLTAMPAQAQDYLKIYFKDGNTERHFMHLVQSITATKYDLDGNLHSDYQMQQIVMPDTTYSYYLADIDSMSFRKYNEERVKKRVESVLASLGTIVKESPTIEDLATHVDEIKNIEGVENAYTDGSDLFVQIRDWFEISYIQQPLPDSRTSAAPKKLSRKKTRSLVPTNKDGSQMKVILAFQFEDDPDFDKSEENFDALCDEFIEMGYDTKVFKGKELDFDFYSKTIFEGNIVFVDTHGTYGPLNKKHLLYTGLSAYPTDWWGKKKSEILQDIGLINYDFDIDDISLSCCDYGGNWIGMKFYWMVREDFIRKSPHRFTNSSPHIVHIGSCENLAGNDILTRSDGERFYGNDSFAKVFFNKGADVYLGYNASTGRATMAAGDFWSWMMKGCSVEEAFDRVRPECKCEEDLEHACLIDLYYSNLEYNNPRGFFIVSTHTQELTDEELTAKFRNDGQVELKGYRACLSDTFFVMGKTVCGFRISTEPNVDQLKNNYKEIGSTNEKFSDATPNEMHFSANFSPTPGETYYYRACTYDGKHYNWGEERSFKIEEQISEAHISCPDENHPHMIDLGLPSGTKWACCNVGAAKPENYGGYYAWGETEEKDTYDNDSYEYYQNDWVDIGSEIAGTIYDVSTVKWGKNWTMPTVSQQEELINNTTSEWTTLNGVEGRLFVGDNGNAIFLPFTGYRDDEPTAEHPGYHSDETFYWSSSRHEYPNFALGLHFNSEESNIYRIIRLYGQPVRPVSNNFSNLQVSSSDLLLEFGNSTIVQISGSGSFEAESSNTQVATVRVDNLREGHASLVIQSHSKGSAIITVTDTKSKQSTIINVTVKGEDATYAAYAVLTDGGKTVTFYYDTMKESRKGVTIGGDDNSYKTATRAIFDKSFADYRPTSTVRIFYQCSKLESIIDIKYLNTNEVEDMTEMFYDCESLKSIDLSKFNTENVGCMDLMFANCKSLSSLDVSSFNTKKVVSMRAMFFGCSSLKKLDLRNFNTEQVAGFGMVRLFEDCTSLTTINVSNFNTKNVIDMQFMFNDCESLLSLDLSNFNTSNVAMMYNMFGGCKSLKSLNLSSFNTEKVTNMGFMFNDCESLESLDLSNFNTNNVDYMRAMFQNCRSLKKLDLSNFKTGNVTDMAGMFNACKSLVSLDISHFDTSNVTNMQAMFSGCESLGELDLSSFNTKNVTNMYSMFSFCMVKTIYVGKSWSTNKVADSDYMFYFSLHLVGGKGTKYNEANIDATYARIDGGASTPGYFTAK